MSRKSERKQERKDAIKLYRILNPTKGYDGLCDRVNDAMIQNDGDIKETMRNTGESFSSVFEASGWKDYYDFVVDKGLEEDKD